MIYIIWYTSSYRCFICMGLHFCHILNILNTFSNKNNVFKVVTKHIFVDEIKYMYNIAVFSFEMCNVIACNYM